MTEITLTQSTFNKNPDTKTTYILQEKEVKVIDSRTHGLITNDDTCKWFRRLGGSENKTMSYTCDGYKCIKLISISPDKQTKKVREFNFKWID